LKSASAQKLQEALIGLGSNRKLKAHGRIDTRTVEVYHPRPDLVITHNQKQAFSEQLSTLKSGRAATLELVYAQESVEMDRRSFYVHASPAGRRANSICLGRHTGNLKNTHRQLFQKSIQQLYIPLKNNTLQKIICCFGQQCLT